MTNNRTSNSNKITKSYIEARDRLKAQEEDLELLIASEMDLEVSVNRLEELIRSRKKNINASHAEVEALRVAIEILDQEQERSSE